MNTYNHPDYDSAGIDSNLIGENNFTLDTINIVYLRTTDNPAVSKLEIRRSIKVELGNINIDNTRKISSRFTYSALECQDELKKAFNEKYLLYTGSEYFIGSYQDMDITFNEVVDRVNRQHDLYFQRKYKEKLTHL